MFLAALAILASMSVRIVTEYDRLVIFFLGKFQGVAGPGIVFVVPGLMSAQKITLRVVVHDVPPQDVISKDNVSIKVNAVVYFQVVDPQKAILSVQDFFYATSQLSQTTLRSVLGRMELDELLANRDKVNSELRQILDSDTEPWGVKVIKVEVKNIDLPPDMVRMIAMQAEAERERRAKIIRADGEFQASEKLRQAALILSDNPVSIQLRYLQSLSEIATEKSSTIVFPIPIDFFSALLKDKKNQA
jgi:regulator of protease activity HflC (stomatin/prohibitin superfamily)